MTKATELRNTFTFEDYNTALSKADYERFFTKTKETVRFTFNGWDGKSYDGEARNAKVIRCNKPGYEDIRFIKCRIRKNGTAVSLARHAVPLQRNA